VWGALTSLPASHRCSSIPLTAVQSLFSTIPCECLHSLANPVLPFPMFSSSNPLISSRNGLAHSFSFASSASIRTVAQVLLIFSTPSKHRTQQRPQLHSVHALTSYFSSHLGWGSPASGQTFFPIPLSLPTQPASHRCYNSFPCHFCRLSATC
jgi:hypothetical protein